MEGEQGTSEVESRTGKVDGGTGNVDGINFTIAHTKRHLTDCELTVLTDLEYDLRNASPQLPESPLTHSGLRPQGVLS